MHLVDVEGVPRTRNSLGEEGDVLHSSVSCSRLVLIPRESAVASLCSLG